MSKWDVFKQPMRVEDTQKIEVEGNFTCQYCGHSCDEAFYVPSVSILTWKCPQGHISTIEEFNV